MSDQSCNVTIHGKVLPNFFLGSRDNDKTPTPKTPIQNPEPQTQKSVAFHTLAFCQWHYDRILFSCPDRQIMLRHFFMVKNFQTQQHKTSQKPRDLYVLSIYLEVLCQKQKRTRASQLISGNFCSLPGDVSQLLLGSLITYWPVLL